MTKSDILDNLKRCETEMRALYIFGSAAHDCIGPDSDVDLLVDYDPARKFSLLDLVGLTHSLEDRLRRPVDLLTPDGIDRRDRRNPG
jgi:predicted nucleotidyltransferase